MSFAKLFGRGISGPDTQLFGVAMLYKLTLVLTLAAPTFASAEATFQATQDPAIRTVVTDPDNPIIVHIGDMRSEVTRFVLCPEVETLMRARSAIFVGDLEGLSAAAGGQGCFLASDGRGTVTALHVMSYAQISFVWLAGNDFDTGAPERLENSGREYWAMSTQTFNTFGGEAIPQLIQRAFD